MHTLARLGIALIVVAACLVPMRQELSAEESDGEAVDWTARVKDAWSRNCAKCHAVPDTRFETDRAFLRQITETT